MEIALTVPRRNTNLVFHREKAEEWCMYRSELSETFDLTDPVFPSDPPGFCSEADNVRATNYNRTAQRQFGQKALLHLLVHVSDLEVGSAPFYTLFSA